MITADSFQTDIRENNQNVIPAFASNEGEDHHPIQPINREEDSQKNPLRKNKHPKDLSNFNIQAGNPKREVASNHNGLKYQLIFSCAVLILSTAISLYYYPFEKTNYHHSSALTILNHSNSFSNTPSSSAMDAIESLNLREGFKRSRETFNGSECEKIYSDVLLFLDSIPVTQMKEAVESLDSLENLIEKNCSTSLEGINPDVFLTMAEIYAFNSMDAKQMKWLSKVEDILPSNPVSSPYISTFIKMYISLASRHTKVGNYRLSLSKLEEAQRLLNNYPRTSSDEEHRKLQSWFLEVFGELNFAEYQKSKDTDEKEFFYKKIERSYIEAINGNLGQNHLLFAGLAQCSLAEFYVKAENYEKAEEVNQKGKKNIRNYFNQEENDVNFQTKCIRNEALMEIARGQYEIAKIKYEEVISHLRAKLPQNNDIINIYQQEYLTFFP